MNALTFLIFEGWVDRLVTVLVLAGLFVLMGMNAVAMITIGFENLIGAPKESVRICYAFVLIEVLIAAVAFIIFGGPR